MSVSFSTPIPFSAVFKEETAKPAREYLNGIPSLEKRMLASHFISLDRESGSKTISQEVHSLLPLVEQNIKDEIINRIFEYQSTLPEAERVGYTILNLVSSLELFELSSENEDNSTRQVLSNPEFELNVFKAYLVLNEELLTRMEMGKDSAKHLANTPYAMAWVLQYGFPYAGLKGVLKELLPTQFIKSFYLFDFLADTPEFKCVLDRFLEIHKSNDGIDFIRRLTPLTHSPVKADKKGGIEFLVDETRDSEVDSEFLDQLCLDPSIVYNQEDYIQIRSRPFFKRAAGHYQLIHHPFVVEIHFKGLFFKLRDIVHQLHGEEEGKAFRGNYGKLFSEEYLMYKVLKRCFPQEGLVHRTGVEMLPDFPQQGEPDYYLRDSNKLLLFESKDFLIEAKAKVSADFKVYEQEFGKRFYYEEKGKMKGAVAQLTKNIVRVLTKPFPFDPDIKSEELSIYPILLVHDTQYNVPGLNLLVNHWFDQEMQKVVDANGKDFIKRVKPITIIDIDTLIYNQDLFSSGKISLTEMLDAYHLTTFPGSDMTIQQQLNTSESFREKLVRYLESENLYTHPKEYMEKAKLLFPEKANS